jgi:hypothetical protein
MLVTGTKAGGQSLKGIVQIRPKGTERTNRYLEVDSESECCSFGSRDKIN